MFDKTKFEMMTSFNDMKYWFIRNSSDSFLYGPRESFLTNEPTIEGTYHLGDFMNYSAEIQEDFKKFTFRPEYYVGDTIKMDSKSASNNNQDRMIDAFETLIVGYIFIRTLERKRNPDDAFQSVTRFLDWIRSTDFYICPASTRFHDAEPCGLLFHTLNVYNNILELRKISKFQTVDYATMTLVSLCHDLTKIGNYESYLRNVKNEQTGEWEKVPSYKWKGNPFPFGHGVASMYIITQFFQLSVEEMLGIRWHMGEYMVSSQETGELEDACERFPIVRMVQFADQLACAKF